MPRARSATPAAEGGSVARLRAAILVRTRFFLWWRLAVRFVEAASLVALARDGHGVGVVAAAACALYDVVLATWLRRSGRTAFWPRLVLDAIDVALWTQAIGTSPDVAALAASPLALEAGLLHDRRGVLVPLAAGGLSAAVSRAAGQPVPLSPFVWPAVALVVAALVSLYLRLRLDQQLRQAGQEIEAAANRAELAGQNSVAAGADSIVDLLSRTTPLLAAGGSPLPPSRLAAWKLALAEASAGQASYLGVVLTRWQRLRNSMSPDLSEDVELRVPEGTGTLLLSPAQARRLDGALDGLRLHGVVSVDVPRPAPAGREQVLLVAGRRLILAADERPIGPSLDLAPIALVIAACAALSHSPARSEAVPLQVTIPLALAALMLALWAHELVARRGAAAHSAVLAAALALGGADAVLTTLTMQNRFTDHMARFPFLLFLTWFGPLFVVYAPDLSQRARWLAMGGAAAVVAAGFALMGEAPPATNLVAAAVWPASTFLVSLRLRDVLEQDERDLAADVGRRHRKAVEGAYQLGRRLVADLVTEAAEDAWALYQRLRGELPVEFATEFERRLADVDRRLCALRDLDEAPAPTPAPAPASPPREAGSPRHVTVRAAGRAALLVTVTVTVAGAAGEVAPVAVAWGDQRRDEGDLAAVVSHALEWAGARWTARSWAWLTAGLAVLALLTAIAMAVWTHTVQGEVGLSAVLLGFALLVAGVGLRARQDGPLPVAALAAVVAGAWALAAVGGWGIAGSQTSPAGLAAAAIAIAIAALVTYPVAPAVAPGAAVVAGAVAGAGVAAWSGLAPVPVAATVAVAGVLCVRALPRGVGLVLSGLTARLPADDDGALEAATLRCRLLLVSLTAGMAAVVLGALLVLLALGDTLALALVAVVVIALLLQAQTYRFAGEVLPPAMAAGIAAVALEAAIGMRSIAAGGDPLGPVALLVVTCFGLAGLAATWPGLRSMPRLPAAAWLLVDLALAPLALGELGVFGAVGQLIRSLLR
jgi:hypothetical protein